MFGWNCRKIIECFVDPGCQAGGRHVVAQYPLIHHLSEETRLRSEFVEHVRDILLPFGGERLLIPGSSAKRNDNDFPLLCRGLSVYKGAATHQGTSESQTSRAAQKITSAAAKMPGELMRRGNRHSR